MKLRSLAFLFLAICTNILQLEAAQPDQVIEFFRHGARAPLSNYDPQWSSSELAQLTTVGMVEHYYLGKTIAEKYPDLVASGYDPDDVYVLSSAAKRCINSAMVHVSSMFRGLTSTLATSSPEGLQDTLISEYTPLLPTDEADRGDYVPVKVNVVVSGTDDYLIFNGRDPTWCPNLATYRNQNMASSEMSQGWTAFQIPVQEANSYLTGSQIITSMPILCNAYDAFIADEYDGKTLPGGITDDDLIESLNYGQAYYQYILEQRQSIQKGLTSFNTFKAITDQLANFRQGNNAKKLVLLSGHDLNIYAVLSALGVISADCLLANYEDHVNNQSLSSPSCQFPHFASNLIVEFYNDTSSPSVKVYYNDAIIPLCNGQDSCSYGDFMTLVQTAGGSDGSLNTWNKNCGSN